MNNKEIKSVLLKSMQALLKPLGFSKSGMVFTKDIGELKYLITLQSSRDSTADKVKLTINVGIWFKALSPGKKADVWEAHLRERIGFLMPEYIDKWWIISSKDKPSFVSNEICNAINDYVLTFLELFPTPKQLVELWESGICPGLTEGQRVRYLKQLKG